jgi:hypothetical protein
MVKMLKNVKALVLLALAIAAVVIVMTLIKQKKIRVETFDGITENSDSRVELDVPPVGTNIKPKNTPVALDKDEIESEFLSNDDSSNLVVESPVAKTAVKPSELLPKNEDGSNWADANPVIDGNMDQSFLDAGFHVGINSVGNSLRNANLQIRSEPANPTDNVSPFLNSTITPDLERRPLEIASEDASAFNVLGYGAESNFESLTA